LSSMRSYWTEPRGSQKMKPDCRVILVISDPVRLIPTLKPNLADPTQLTWMKMKKRCSKNAEQDWQIQKERKQNEKPEKSNSKKLGD